MVQAEVVNHYQQVLASLWLSLHLGLHLLKVTRGQHIKAGGREESSQLTWREEGSSLLAWRREDKESLLSWRRSTLKDGRCHLCRVAGAQRRLRGARRGQEVDQPCSRHADLPHLLGGRVGDGCCGACPQHCSVLACLHTGGAHDGYGARLAGAQGH